MAKQHLFLGNGRIGNVIFYQWKGINCARIATGRVKQSMATKQSAKHFGKAVQLSRSLRMALWPALPNYRNQQIMYKMNSALFSWLHQAQPGEKNISLIGLELNDKTPFRSRFRKELLAGFDTKGKVTITVPQLKIPNDIIAPSNVLSVRLDIAIGGAMLDRPLESNTASVSVEIPYIDGLMPAITKELEYDCKSGSINVVAVSLHYMIKKNGEEQEIADDRWKPATILAAVTR